MSCSYCWKTKSTNFPWDIDKGRFVVASKFCLKNLYLPFVNIKCKHMTTYTSSLPEKLLNRLAEVATELSLPKNKIIERALEIYLTELDKARYARSFQQYSDDPDILSIAEEGLDDYYLQLKEHDEAG